MVQFDGNSGVSPDRQKLESPVTDGEKDADVAEGDTEPFDA